MSKPHIAALFAALTLTLAAGAARADGPVYAGQVTAHMRASVAFDDGRAVVFLCGDADTVATDTHWMSGDGEVNGRWWRFTDRDWTVWVAAIDGYAIGALERPGHRTTWFYAGRASGDLGLYRAETEYGVVGAIVTDLDRDGELELQGAIRTPAGAFFQVVPLSPMVIEPGVIDVLVPTEADMVAVEVPAVAPATL